MPNKIRSNLINNLHRITQFVELGELLRYGTTGIALNLLSFGAYLFLVGRGVDPKVVVTFLYPITVLIGYFLNGKLAFQSGEIHTNSFFRFFLAHFSGYLINLILLHILIDIQGVTPSVAQLTSIFIVAAYLYFVFKIYVFKSKAGDV